MAQTLTSKATSINKVKLPAVFRKACFRSDVILDYGCGKYTDHIRSHLNGKEYLPFDPFNQPDEVNRATHNTINNAIKKRIPVDVVCSNVLNVIDDSGTIRTIAEGLESLTAATGGTAYITVYEGNRSGIGKQTGPDQYQRNEPLSSYLRYFRNATIKNGMIIVSSKKC